MQIDEIEIPKEIDIYYRESLAALSDQAFILGCRKLPALTEVADMQITSIVHCRLHFLSALDEIKWLMADADLGFTSAQSHKSLVK